MRVEILGEERPRRWSDEKKLDIVMIVGIDWATVTEVARRHDVTRQQIYTWRSELRRKMLLLPSAADGAARLTSGQMAMLWEGIDWRRPNWGAPPLVSDDLSH